MGVVVEHNQLAVDNNNLDCLLKLLRNEDISQELIDYLKAANRELSESVPLRTQNGDVEIDVSRLKDLLIASLEHTKRIKREEESQVANVLCEEPDPSWARDGEDMLSADGGKLPHRIVRPTVKSVWMDTNF